MTCSLGQMLDMIRYYNISHQIGQLLGLLSTKCFMAILAFDFDRKFMATQKEHADIQTWRHHKFGNTDEVI